MKMMSCSFRVLSALSIALLLGGNLVAQATGGLIGTVTDNGGAFVPGAQVSLTNLATNEIKVTQSGANGDYQFVQLLPANYKVTVEKSGFQQFVEQPVQVAVGVTSRVTATLQVGSATETVQVTTEAPLLSTQSSSLDYGVEAKQVQELPLNGRNPLNLMELVPGVVPQGDTSGNAIAGNNTGWGNYQIGGGVANQSAMYIDGAPINASGINKIVLVITQDAAQEFQVATNNVSPQYGRFAGGVVNIATKSGSNTFHGTLYEYVRNAALNANLFFNKRSGLPRPVYSQNQYGATAGGPAIKGKAFFFLSWEQFDLLQASATNTTVPTANMLAGNFSELLTLAKPLQLYNPSDTSCGGARCPFAGNMIPTSLLNGTSKILGPLLWPSPTSSLSPAAGTNFSITYPKYIVYNQYTARGDEQIGTRNKLFERYTTWIENPVANTPLNNDTGTKSYFTTLQAVVGDTITINQNLVADVHASFLRLQPSRGGPFTCCNFNLSQLGPNWAPYQSSAYFAELPEPNVSGMYNFSTIPSGGGIDNTYAVTGSLTTVLGRHSLEFGGEVRKMYWEGLQSNSSSGTFGFSNNFTGKASGAPASGTGASGYAFADFMLGYPVTGSAQEPYPNMGIAWYGGLYVADSFRWTPKLTINAGLRWEQPGAFSEQHGSLTVMQLNMPQPTLPQVNGKAVTGGLALINSPQYSGNDTWNLHWDLFAPRVGFAYSPTNTWVVRGGYGISYVPITAAYSVGPYNTPTNSAVTTLTQTLTTPTVSLSNPFPSGITKAAGRSQAYVNGLLGQGVQSTVPDQPMAYSQQWNLGFQKQIGSTVAVNVGYVGSHGVHLPLYSINADQLPNQYDICGTDSTQPQCGGHLLTDKVANPFYGIIPASAGTLGAQTVQYAYLLKPYPQYLYMTIDGPTVGEVSYEALQVQVQKRLHGNGIVSAAYTYSTMKGTADVLSPWLEANRFGVGGSIGVQDNTNINGNSSNPGEYSLSSFQLPQRLVVNYVYPLPFGHGQKFLNNSNRLINGVVGNWAINGISTFQSGFPMAFEDANPNTLEGNFAAGNAGPGTGAGVSRPNFTAGCSEGVSGKPGEKLAKYFNTSCFSAPTAWQFGNAPRVDSTLRNQGIDSTDFSAAKDFPFHDRYRLDVRAEIFNVANWTQFSPPNTQVDSTLFGQVTAQYNQPRLIQFSGRFSF